MTHPRRSPRFTGRNLLAILTACGALGIVHLHSDPEAIGGSPHDVGASTLPPVMIMPPSPAMPVALDETEAAASEGTEGNVQIQSHVEDPATLRGIWALKMTSELLRRGIDSFSKVQDYTASLYKQERLNGLLGEGQTIEVKMKHEPFSVYMKWLGGDYRGQQLIYVEGENDGNLLVQPGGIKGRLTGTLSLEPTASLAMAQSRHPVTKAGLVELAKTILDFQDRDIARGDGFTCELHDNQVFNDRACYLFSIVWDSEEINPDYRKSMVFVDKEYSMPVCVKNFCWAKDANPETIDEETLVEFYAYSDLKLLQKLDVADFDPKNRDYRMRVRR